MRIWIGIALAASACGEDTKPTPDAAITLDAESIDAPGATCPTSTSCPCFTNYDCPAGYRCHSQDDTGTMVYCEQGARGTGAVGTACTGEADCASALCVDTDSAGMQCSDLCEDGTMCTADLPTCLFIATEGISICAP